MVLIATGLRTARGAGSNGAAVRLAEVAVVVFRNTECVNEGAGW